jgi:hypothetical protein
MKFASIIILPFNLVNLTADESIDAPFNPAPKFTSGNKVFNAKPLINDPD